MLEVRNLSKKYNDQWAVENVSFEVAKGEVLVLLGTSGCGKTTTLKIINRLVEKSAGEVFINGSETSLLPPYQLRRNIGYVIQETGLFPHCSIEKNIGTVPELLGWSEKRISDRVDELMHLIGLDVTLKSRMPDELSGGQRQRVGLARALAADPSVVLLDEPFGALDPITRNEMQQEFLKLEGALEKAMVLVTHDVVEAVKLADKICLMDKGLIQQIGSPQQLIFQPKNDFVKAFFASKLLEIEPTIIKLSDLVCGLEELENTEGTKLEPNVSLIEASNERGTVDFEYLGKHYRVENIMSTYYKLRDQIIENLSANA